MRMKKSRSKPPSSDPPIGLSDEYMARLEWTMAFYDELTVEEAALIGEYGFGRAVRALRIFPHSHEEARAFLEEERKALQVARYGSRT